jgi:Probable cobalt transporter subunit (CbtA)
MVRALLVRGMLAGLVAGVAAFAFAWVFGEPRLEVALGFEHQLQHMAGQPHEPELVSRMVQSTLGLLTGIVVYACALGGLFAVVFAYCYGRIGTLSPRATAALLAAAGFIALILVPQLKFPANPPAVGDPKTIGFRTALHFTMLGLSLISAVAAASTGRQLAHRFGAWNGGMLAAGAYVVASAAAMLILPSVSEVPAPFPATALWNFRLASLGIEAVLWTVLGLVFGALAERQLASAPASATTG